MRMDTDHAQAQEMLHQYQKSRGGKVDSLNSPHSRDIKYNSMHK